MKLAFTGDLSFHNINKYTNNPFKNIINGISNFNCVINLESVFLPKTYNKSPIKQKICLRQDNESIKYLKKIKPFLINLSNNHINDYGNFGIRNTQKILKKNNIKYFGVGLSKKNHNVFVLKKEKIIFLSYCTRSTDLSSSKLFNEKNFLGPKEFNFKFFKKQIKNYQDYKKIVLFHWGLENRKYPHPKQRYLARKIIREGADLVIGNHAHVIQGFEKYRNKYIFYSLSNFLFPHFYYSLKKSNYQKKENKESIVPIFNIEEDIKLDKILNIKSNKKFELYFKCNDSYIRHKELKIDMKKYLKIYNKEYIKFKIIKKLKRPIQISNKLILFIKELQK